MSQESKKMSDKPIIEDVNEVLGILNGTVSLEELQGKLHERMSGIKVITDDLINEHFLRTKIIKKINSKPDMLYIGKEIKAGVPPFF